jgi:hypothetical protein
MVAVPLAPATGRVATHDASLSPRLWFCSHCLSRLCPNPSLAFATLPGIERISRIQSYSHCPSHLCRNPRLARATWPGLGRLEWSSAGLSMADFRALGSYSYQVFFSPPCLWSLYGPFPFSLILCHTCTYTSTRCVCNVSYLSPLSYRMCTPRMSSSSRPRTSPRLSTFSCHTRLVPNGQA